eukprot:7007624-Pyramimonas_sp.AAC.1
MNVSNPLCQRRFTRRGPTIFQAGSGERKETYLYCATVEEGGSDVARTRISRFQSRAGPERCFAGRRLCFVFDFGREVQENKWSKTNNKTKQQRTTTFRSSPVPECSGTLSQRSGKSAAPDTSSRAAGSQRYSIRLHPT